MKNQCNNEQSACRQTAGEASSTRRADQIIEQINHHCFCLSLPQGALQNALEQELASPEIFQLIEQRCPHLFSAQPVFIASSQSARIADLIHAIDQLVQNEAYRDTILQRAPAIARHTPRNAKGVFFGYDFHVNEDKIGLIEVNTNAGGAMLNAVLARSQHACCAVMDDIVHSSSSANQFEEAIIAMFLQEWKLAHADVSQMPALATIAIVDSDPQGQYLYPEFLLFQRLFARHGMTALIAAPTELSWRDGRLWHGEVKIDMVYNRLTDFYLAEPDSDAIRQAYLADAIVLTPHPQAHALYADKSNLALWTDRAFLEKIGISGQVQEQLLENIPHSEVVRQEHAERLWANRRHLFFKPNAGFGGRAAYRGDKITKRVWDEILAGDYIAQAIVTPGERVSGTPEAPTRLKFDLRYYAYDGAVQWIAARMYQGQTTNFRTPGGGFAPVYSIADADLLANLSMI